MVKEIYYSHKLFSSSSCPENLMDFILINDEAEALWAEGVGVSPERRRKSKKDQRLSATDVQEGLSLRAPLWLEDPTRIGDF